MLLLAAAAAPSPSLSLSLAQKYTNEPNLALIRCCWWWGWRLNSLTA